jgi:uncharacterized membrane protein
MPSLKSGTKPETGTEELGLERIVFFSDAVMAIAITLLAIDLKVPEFTNGATSSQLLASLTGMGTRFMSFFVSFVVVGVYWTSHHRYFRYIKRYDGVLIFLNLLFLLFIILMPFVASLLGINGFMPVGVITYAAAVALTGLAISALWWYASTNHRLVAENLDIGFIRSRNLMALLVPIIFLVSIPFALINPLIAMVIWWASPLVSIATLRLTERRMKGRKGKG